MQIIHKLIVKQRLSIVVLETYWDAWHVRNHRNVIYSFHKHNLHIIDLIVTLVSPPLKPFIIKSLPTPWTDFWYFMQWYWALMQATSFTTSRPFSKTCLRNWGPIVKYKETTSLPRLHLIFLHYQLCITLLIAMISYKCSEHPKLSDRGGLIYRA